MPSRIFADLASVLDAASAADPRIGGMRLQENEHLTFIVGAGASAPAPSSIPTVSDLLGELWARAERIDQEPLNRLRTWCDSNNIGNIEHLLTAAYLSDVAVTQPALANLLEFFLFGPDDRDDGRAGRRARRINLNAAAVSQIHGTLDSLFALLMGLMIDAEPNAAHKAIGWFAKRHSATSIVTTNYDPCVDLALDNHHVKYGYRIENWPGMSDPEGVRLVKVHGSVNWSYCDACQEVRVFRLREVRNAYKNDTLSYAVVGICKNCQAQRQPMIVPPLAVKMPIYAPLFSLWEQARAAFEEASLIVAVGYSFADADAYLTRMIELAVQHRDDVRIVVVDKDSAVSERLRKRLRAHVQNFDEDRVLSSAEAARSIYRS